MNINILLIGRFAINDSCLFNTTSVGVVHIILLIVTNGYFSRGNVLLLSLLVFFNSNALALPSGAENNSCIMASPKWRGLDHMAVGDNARYCNKNLSLRLRFDAESVNLSAETILSQAEYIYDQFASTLIDEYQPTILINIRVVADQHRFQQYLTQLAPELKTTTAFYSAESNQLVVFWNGHQEQVYGFIRHEVTHLIMRSLYPYIPLWLNEGLAEYFEALTTNGLPAINNYWLMTLHEKKRMSLSLFFRLSNEQWRAKDQKRMYAMAWSLVFYMMSTESARELLMALMQRSVQWDLDSQWSRHFIESNYVGGIDALNSDWLAWLSSNGYAQVW